MDFGIINIGIITVICYFTAEILKNFVPKFNNKYLPIFCGTLGGILGVVSMHVIDSFPATDYLSAVGIGIASGLAATGTNQIYKQLSINSGNIYNATAGDKYKSAQNNQNTDTSFVDNTAQYTSAVDITCSQTDPNNDNFASGNNDQTTHAVSVGDKDA